MEFSHVNFKFCCDFYYTHSIVLVFLPKIEKNTVKNIFVRTQVGRQHWNKIKVVIFSNGIGKETIQDLW